MGERDIITHMDGQATKDGIKISYDLTPFTVQTHRYNHQQTYRHNIICSIFLTSSI